MQGSWAKMASVGLVESHREGGGAVSIAQRFFLTSMRLPCWRQSPTSATTCAPAGANNLWSETPGSAGDDVARAVGGSGPAAVGPLAVDLGVSPSADHAHTDRAATSGPLSRADRLMSANMGHLPCDLVAFVILPDGRVASLVPRVDDNSVQGPGARRLAGDRATNPASPHASAQLIGFRISGRAHKRACARQKGRMVTRYTQGFRQ